MLSESLIYRYCIPQSINSCSDSFHRRRYSAPYLSMLAHTNLSKLNMHGCFVNTHGCFANTHGCFANTHECFAIHRQKQHLVPYPFTSIVLASPDKHNFGLIWRVSYPPQQDPKPTTPKLSADGVAYLYIPRQNVVHRFLDQIEGGRK